MTGSGGWDPAVKPSPPMDHFNGAACGPEALDVTTPKHISAYQVGAAGQYRAMSPGLNCRYRLPLALCRPTSHIALSTSRAGGNQGKGRDKQQEREEWKSNVLVAAAAWNAGQASPRSRLPGGTRSQNGTGSPENAIDDAGPATRQCDPGRCPAMGWALGREIASPRSLRFRLLIFWGGGPGEHTVPPRVPAASQRDPVATTGEALGIQSAGKAMKTSRHAAGWVVRAESGGRRAGSLDVGYRDRSWCWR
ncbi:hypothetical protein K456DRAFT_1758106 [Colletotrichum gloeosporioides 23]|nr:hypothetical protein K456DRAFT_1758106 [Colletotrichum gloeosporioides 23]